MKKLSYHNNYTDSMFKHIYIYIYIITYIKRGKKQRKRIPFILWDFSGPWSLAMLRLPPPCTTPRSFVALYLKNTSALQVYLKKAHLLYLKNTHPVFLSVFIYCAGVVLEKDLSLLELR